MDTAAEVLVIIVSSVLAIFLIISIVLIVKVIKVVNEIKLAVARAEDLADSLGNLAETVGKSVGPISLLKLVYRIMNQSGGKSNKRKRKDD